MRLDGAPRVGGGGAARRDLAPRAGALRRLQRALGAPVDVDRAARRRTLRDRALVHPPPRPGARVRQASAGRPRRTGALARGGRGGAAGADRRCAAPGAAMPEPTDGGARSVAYLGPAGTFSEEALLDERAPGQRRAGGRREHPGGGRRRCRTARSSSRSCRSRTRSRARSTSRSTCSPSRTERCAIVGETLLRRPPLPDRGSGAARWRAIETVVSHPQVPGQCTRFLRTELRAGGDPRGGLDRRGGAGRGRSRRRRDRRARHRARRGDLRRRSCCARASRTARTTRRASCGSPAAASAADEPPLRDDGGDGGERRRRRSSSGARATRHAGWLVRCLDEFAAREINLTRSSRARDASSSATTCSSSSSPATSATNGWRPRSPGCAASANACSCSAPTGARSPRRGARTSTATPRRRASRPALPPAVEHGRAAVSALSRACSRYTAAGPWRAPPHQSRWGPCRPPSTSGTDLIPRRARRWVAGCSSSTRRSSRSTSARCGARSCCCSRRRRS